MLIATSTDITFADILKFITSIGDYFSNFVSSMPSIFVVIFSIYISIAVIYMIVGRQA